MSYGLAMGVVDVVGTAVVVTLAAGLVVGARRVRSRHWSARGLFVATCAALAVLVVMVVSDWPTNQLNAFWAEHSVLAAVVTTVLLAAVAFLAFEAREATAQEQLSEKVSVAGLAGLVDHLVDVDLVLFMLREGRTVSACSNEGRPLRWLTDTRRLLQAEAKQSGGARRDNPDLLTQVLTPEARADLVSQATRRVAGGMRDWASLLGVSSDGRAALVSVGEVRLHLLRLAACVADGDPCAEAVFIDHLRRHVQLLAHVFETASSGDLSRPGVFTRSAQDHTAGLDDERIDLVRAQHGKRLSVLLEVVEQRKPLRRRDE